MKKTASSIENLKFDWFKEPESLQSYTHVYLASRLGRQIRSSHYARMLKNSKLKKVCWHCGEDTGFEIIKHPIMVHALSPVKVPYRKSFKPWKTSYTYTYLCERCIRYIEKFGLPPVFNQDSSMMIVEDALSTFKDFMDLNIPNSVFNPPWEQEYPKIVNFWKKFIGGKVNNIRWSEVRNPLKGCTLYEDSKSHGRYGSPKEFDEWVLQAADQLTAKG